MSLDPGRVLTFMAWATVICLVVVLFAWLLLKWIAVRIARRVADLAERHIGATVQRGLERTSSSSPGLWQTGVADDTLRARYLRQINGMARLMDRAIPLPIVGGIGLDAVLGLVPVAGDVAGFAISSFIVIRAAQLGVPESLIGRLVAVQMTDLLLGALPIAGDVFDVAYHADEKSAALVREWLASRTDT